MKNSFEKAEMKDKDYYYHMGRVDALKEVLGIAKDQFMTSKINSDCFVAVTAVVDEMIDEVEK